MTKNVDFKSLAQNFKIDGEFIFAESFGCGHINDTYAVYFKRTFEPPFRCIFQRINNNVFKNPIELMKNINGVTTHLRKKIVESGGDADRETLTIIYTNNGESYYIDDEGSYWRSYIFVENAVSHQTVDKPELFYNSARAFGKFQRLLADYPANTLFETIPDFHNTVKRFEALEQAVSADICDRAKDVKAEIDFAFARKNDVGVLVELLNNNELPLRVTHNDTKLNNVLLDIKTGEGVCVIDLDTVMPGLSLYDFSDSIRFGANPAAEDEKDLSKVYMDISLFKAYTEGFLSEAGEILTEKEIEMLPVAAKIMTFECGIRFLTDYLSGDTYFKIHREGHNLDRCRTQFKLVYDMENKLDLMNDIVAKRCKK